MDMFDVTGINSMYGAKPQRPVTPVKNTTGSESFASIFDAALNMVEETNTLQNKADAEEIKFALGQAENTHDMAIAQNKANIALQYTVAVRDKFITAYNEIMQMQM